MSPVSGAGGPAGSAGAAGTLATSGAGATSSAGAGAGTPAMPMTDAGMAMPPARDASTDSGTDAAPVPCASCVAYAAPMRSGAIASSELSALSGLAASRTQPDLFYAHNDHDRPIVYALDAQGALLARITLEGAQAIDIEDIAVGPCGAESCIYLGDIGDNAAARDEYAILRLIEPTVPKGASAAALTSPFERQRFTYDDGSHNAEALMAGPDGNLFVVTKLAPGSGGRVPASGPSSVYRLSAPLSAASVAVATKVATLPVPADGDLAAAAAAAHPCGLGFLLRTYDKVYEFRIAEGAAFETAFAVAPVVVAMPDEPQSEGIAYRADGRGFLTAGEGLNAPIYATACE